MVTFRVTVGSRNVPLERVGDVLTKGEIRDRIEREAATLGERVRGVRCPTHGEGAATILLSDACDASPATQDECCAAFRSALTGAARRA